MRRSFGHKPVLTALFFLALFFGCMSETDQIRSDVEVGRSYLDGKIDINLNEKDPAANAKTTKTDTKKEAELDVSGLSEDCIKGKELLQKYFEHEKPDSSNYGKFKADQIKGADEILKREVAYIYVSNLLGSLNVSLLQLMVNILKAATDKKTKDTPFAQFQKVIPPELRTKKGVDANIDTLDLVQKVIEFNFKKDIESGLIKKSSKYLLATTKTTTKNNTFLYSLAIVSCFTSIIRSTVLGTVLTGLAVDSITAPKSSGDAADALNDIKDLSSKEAGTFLDDFDNITSFGCVASGIVQDEGEFMENMKALREGIFTEMDNLSATLGEDDAKVEAVMDFMYGQYGYIEDPTDCKEVKVAGKTRKKCKPVPMADLDPDTLEQYQECNKIGVCNVDGTDTIDSTK